MTRDELIAAVPIYERDGRPYFIRITEIPEPWQSQFKRGIFGAQCPIVNGERGLAYSWDWLQWARGGWYGGHNAPANLDDA